MPIVSARDEPPEIAALSVELRASAASISPIALRPATLLPAPTEPASLRTLDRPTATLFTASPRARIVACLPSTSIKRAVLKPLPPSMQVSLTSMRERARALTAATPMPALARKATVQAVGEPLLLSVSLRLEKPMPSSAAPRGHQLNVSSGMPGHPTPTGIFTILEKERWHRSNIYSGAPMPFMQRLAWTGVAMHEGAVHPGHTASHGCIRLQAAFAPKLFQMTSVGGNVVIAGDRLHPQAHPAPHSSAAPRFPWRTRQARLGRMRRRPRSAARATRRRWTPRTLSPRFFSPKR